MATNFSPCKGSYVLNKFPSNVMFSMNGFHVSASGAIQGHHGPLVLDETILTNQIKAGIKPEVICIAGYVITPQAFSHLRLEKSI